MKPKRIVREPEACNRLGCRRTKFRNDYRFNNQADPNVPNTGIPRLRPVPLGVRNVGYIDGEIDDLIDALAALRDTPEVGTTRVFLTDALPASTEMKTNGPEQKQPRRAASGRGENENQ
jgi:predicted DNA-binding transcriptional regulator AlpA